MPLSRPAMLLGWGLAMATTGAAASSRDVAQQAWFEGFDRDGDGRISAIEYEDYFSAGFDAIDRNGDGRLDLDELPTSRQRSPTRERHAHRRAVQRTFARLDTDRDGWLDLRELTAPPR